MSMNDLGPNLYKITMEPRLFVSQVTVTSVLFVILEPTLELDIQLLMILLT